MEEIRTHRYESNCSGFNAPAGGIQWICQWWSALAMTTPWGRASCSESDATIEIIDYIHLTDWLTERINAAANSVKLTCKQQMHILYKDWDRTHIRVLHTTSESLGQYQIRHGQQMPQKVSKGLKQIDRCGTKDLEIYKIYTYISKNSLESYSERV